MTAASMKRPAQPVAGGQRDGRDQKGQCGEQPQHADDPNARVPHVQTAREDGRLVGKLRECRELPRRDEADEMRDAVGDEQEGEHEPHACLNAHRMPATHAR